MVGEHDHEPARRRRPAAIFTGGFTLVYLYVYTSVYLPVFTYFVVDWRGEGHTASL